MARLALLLAAALAALCVAARAQDLPKVAVLVGSSDPVSRGDYMQDAMDGAVFGCGGADGDVSRLLTSGSDTFEGSLCTVMYVTRALYGPQSLAGPPRLAVSPRRSQGASAPLHPPCPASLISGNAQGALHPPVPPPARC